MRARRTGASLCQSKLSSRPLAGAALIGAALLVAPAACSKNKTSTNVSMSGEDGAGEPGQGLGTAGRGGGGGDHEGVRGSIQKMQVTGSITGVGDMLDASSQLINMWVPPEPGAPPINLRSMLDVGLVQEGFGPGFVASFDLDGVHAAQVGIPHDNQPGVTDRDIDVAVSLAAIDPVRAIESLPAAARPQPLGDNLWQIADQDIEILFRAGQRALEIGLNMESLDVARSLPSKVAVGPTEPRIKVSATNIPPANIDMSELIPLPPELARTLSSIVDETKSVEFAADFGTDRDLTARMTSKAPFGRLGLDPIGPATQQPSALAKALPGDAMFVWVMPWGDPKLLHTVLDKRIPVNEIPAPFNGYVDDVIAGAHGVLAAIKGEILATAYIDKGKFTLVLAGEVSDEAAARKSIRAVFSAAEKALQDHIALAGNSPDHKYTVSYKQDVLKLGKGKGDLFTVTLPKDMQDDVDSVGWLVGDKKPQLEISSIVVDGKLIVAIGAGQKSTMSAIGRRLGKTPDDGLESGGGLALARKLAGGCQYCIAIDPVEVGEMIFTAIAANEDEPADVQKAASKAVSALAKLSVQGELAFAMRLDDNEGAFGFGVPKSLVFVDAAKAKSVVDLVKSIDEAREKAWASSEPSAVAVPPK